MASLLVRDGLILTMNDDFDILEGDVLVKDGRIAAVGVSISEPYDRVVDAQGGYVLPGFIQTHIHLCQTLFRGYADDLPLMEWLRQRIWPMEAAHTPATLRAAARLASAELLTSGTTSVLTMETVHDTDAVFEAVDGTGLRATIGKCMMDAGEHLPPRLHEETRAAIDESLALQQRWDGRGNGRLRAALAPRFAVSCSRNLLEEVGVLAERQDLLVHTHASESRDEVHVMKKMSGGLSNVEYLASLGLASHRLCAAHCVWLSERDQRLLAEHDIKVMHCPGSNLKLGSGVAPIAELRKRGVTVSLGTDGAACNNSLDMFEEMRLAAALQAVRRRPGSLISRDVLWMATRAGARTLGLDRELGSIEPGKAADLIVIERDRPHLAPGPDPYSTLVYAARGSDVQTTIIGGDVLVEGGRLTGIDHDEVIAEARTAAQQLAARADRFR